MKEYLVIFERGPNNWSAYVPDLPGCVAAGDTREQTEVLIREALDLHIEAMREDGETAPEPSTFGSQVAVAS